MLCHQPPLVATVDEQPTWRSNLVNRRFHGTLPSMRSGGAYRGEGCKGTGFALKPGSPHCISPEVARSAEDRRAEFCSDEGKCGHAARLVGPSRLTHTGCSPRHRVASI